MSPISHGRMYSSARPGIPASAKLHVLFTGQHVSGVVQALDVVHDYIADLGKTEVGIIVHTVVSNIDTTNSDHAKIISLDIQDTNALLSYASENNIDIIHDSEAIFTRKERFKHRESFIITNMLPELTVQLESYLTGNDIAWNFANATWHTSWIYKYSMQPGVSSITFGFIGTGQEKKYTPKQMEFVRALANKTMHIEHAREQLYYYLQLKRRAFRTGNPNDERLLLPLFAPYIEQGEIANLNAFNFYARLSSVIAQEPLSGRTLLLDSAGSDVVAEQVIEASRKQYAQKPKPESESKAEPLKSKAKSRKSAEKADRPEVRPKSAVKMLGHQESN